MDIRIQIQSIKSQIENMKLQIDNIEMQNNSNMMVNPSILAEQIINISIQMFNSGIQAFNAGKNMNMMINMQNNYNKLKTISEQLNSILIENSLQQLSQQIMMNQQMQEPQLIIPKDKINLEFDNPKGWKLFLNTDLQSTVEEALNKLINMAYSSCNKKLEFLSNGYKIKRDEKRKIKDFFHGTFYACIIIVEF